MLTKHLGSTDSVNFLQDINYTYNERGWLLTDSAALFNERLQYNDTTGIAGISPKAQYNGNIASQSFGTDTLPYAKSFVYTYDRLNRLTSGVQDTSFAERNISYDQAGNIQTLSRVYNHNLIDSLTYEYPIISNQLLYVYDASTDTSGFGYKRGPNHYAYDGNGNIIIGSNNLRTQYNLLNQPAVVSNGPVNISPLVTRYYHDASGEKIARYALNKNTGPKGEFDYSFYDDGLQYDINRATFSTQQNIFLQTEEGRVFPYSTDSTNYYQYYLTDHLGNTRVAFDTPHDTLKVEQQDDYLPFGMEISKGTIGNPKNEYLYNKKELQENTQLYDYGARFYDPAIGRFTAIDPLAEKDRRWSSYNYGMNNPIRFIDSDGMEADDPNKPKPLLLTIDKKALQPSTTVNTTSSRNTSLGDNALVQFAPVDNTINSVSETKTSVTTGTYTDLKTGKVSMTSSTVSTTTTVSLGVTKDGQISGITNISQSTSITTTSTPVVSENKTSATLDVSATKTVNYGTTTQSLPVSSKLSTGLQENVKDATFENKSALQHNIRTILYPDDKTNK